jgi:hypothetical protein
MAQNHNGYFALVTWLKRVTLAHIRERCNRELGQPFWFLCLSLLISKTSADMTFLLALGMTSSVELRGSGLVSRWTRTGLLKSMLWGTSPTAVCSSRFAAAVIVWLYIPCVRVCNFQPSEHKHFVIIWGRGPRVQRGAQDCIGTNNTCIMQISAV